MAAPGSAWVGRLAIEVERVPDNGDGGLARGRLAGVAKLRREQEGKRQRNNRGRGPS